MKNIRQSIAKQKAAALFIGKILLLTVVCLFGVEQFGGAGKKER